MTSPRFGSPNRDLILSRIGEITSHLDECVAARRPEDFCLTYNVATRKRKRERNDDIHLSYRLDDDGHRSDTADCGNCQTENLSVRGCEQEEFTESEHHCPCVDCGDKQNGWNALCQSLDVKDEANYRYSDEFDINHGLNLDAVQHAFNKQTRGDHCSCDDVKAHWVE